MNFPPNAKLSRRRWLGLSVGAVVLSGCTPRDDSAPGDATDSALTGRRLDVPLRIVLVGDPSVAETIEKTWSGIAEQALDLSTLTLSDAGNPSIADPETAQLAHAARDADVLIYPSLLQGQLVQGESVIPFPDAALADDRLQADRLYPALRSGPMQYGKEPIAIPLGAVVPALLLATSDWDDQEAISWERFNEGVAASPKGRAAEPLAQGWAARMFLHRANGYCDDAWLFDRDSFRPLLMREAYRKALSQMVEVAEFYPDRRLGPDEIWEAIQAGELDVAIGWPTSQAGNQAVGGVRVQPLPAADQWYSEAQAAWIDRDPERASIFLSGDGLVASISARCRQTAAANEFLHWLSREQTSAELRERVAGMTATRFATGGDSPDARRSYNAVATQHEAYLREQLSTTRMRTMLRIPAANHYLAVLDAEVLRAVDGEQSVDEALRRVVNAWETITIEQGREEQLRHWRKSTGLRY